MYIPGKLVKVNGINMHVFSKILSQNQQTIVFLSGSGTECPLYDFKPLWYLLIDKYNIVVVDRPGYGWSDQTPLPRTIDNLMEETREALKQAELSSPFILAPHSLSGLEALYWAQKYPDEISAIIGLDMAVPSVYDIMKLPSTLSLQVLLAHLLRKPISKSMVKNHPAVKKKLLSEDERSAMEYIIAKQLLSNNMIDEIDYVKENANKIADGECPVVPVLCCLSNDKANIKRIPTWGKAHREYFASNNQVMFLELSCGHYVHRENPEAIVKAIEEFLSEE